MVWRRLVLVLSIPHPRVVEVVKGWVDVTHMTSSVHHHRRLPRSRSRRSGRTEHHLGLDVCEGLHAGEGGGREGRPGLWLGRVLEVLALGGRQLGERHDGGVLVLVLVRHRPGDPSSVRETVGELLQTLRLRESVQCT